MLELARKGLSRPIKIKAPLLGLEKEDVIELLKAFGVSEDEYFSGYGDLDDSLVGDEWRWT